MPTTDAVIKKIIQEALPLEAESIEDPVLDQCIHHRGRPPASVEISGGHDFDLNAVLEVIKTAIECAVVYLELRKLLVERGQPPTAANLLREAPVRPQPNPLTSEDATRIAEAVAALREKDDKEEK